MLLYISGLAALWVLFLLAISVIFFKTDLRLYWKEIAIFAGLQMVVFIYTPYVVIWWNKLAAGNDILVYVFYLFLPVIYAPLFLYDYIFYPLIFTLFRKKQIDNSYARLFQNVGVSARVVVVEKLKNAYAMGVGKVSTIVLGKDLVEKMSPDELNGIVCHEAAHLKFHHLRVLLIIEIIKIYIFCFVSYVSFKLSGGNPYIFIPVFGVVGGFMAYARMPMRRYEKQTDLFAANMVGPDTYISALKRLNEMTGKKMDNFDIEHPRLKNRIKHITDTLGNGSVSRSVSEPGASAFSE